MWLLLYWIIGVIIRTNSFVFATSAPSCNPSSLPTEVPTSSPSVNPAYLLSEDDFLCDFVAATAIENYPPQQGKWSCSRVDLKCVDWPGISCASEGYIRSITFSGNYFADLIPSTIGSLTKLEYLYANYRSHYQVRGITTAPLYESASVFVMSSNITWETDPSLPPT